MTNQIYCFAIYEFEPIPVLVEGQIQSGLPVFSISGLADTSINEAKERVINAIKNSGYKLSPNKKYINLLPASLPKRGTHFDLAIAVSILSASKVINILDQEVALVGELSLEGHLIPVTSTIPMIKEARRKGLKKIIIPKVDFEIENFFQDIEVVECENLKEVCNYLENKIEKPPLKEKKPFNTIEIPEIAHIYGLERAKKALEIALAGNHHFLLIGAKGSGKSSVIRLAKYLSAPLHQSELLEKINILNYIEKRPDPSGNQVVEIKAIDSLREIFGNTKKSIIGKIHRAHRGSLICNDLNLFSKQLIQNLLPLLEYAYDTNFLRSKFNLLATANPCPCTYLYESYCECRPMSIKNYLEKFEGAFLDRIDIQIKVTKQEFKGQPWNIQESAVKIAKIREMQSKRGKLNADLNTDEVMQYLDSETINFLNLAQQKFNFSNRAYASLLKISRTIADLHESPNITKDHLLEALDFKKDFLKTSS